MEYRNLGRTNLAVSILGFGALEIGRNWPYWRKDKSDFARPNDEDAIRVIHKALDAGINFFDTAPAYQDSERILGNAFRGIRKDIVIGTKCGEWFDGENSVYDYSYNETKKFIENSLRLLKTDYIDLLQIHSASVDVIRRGETLEAMKEAQSEGKVRFLGFSTDSEEAALIGISNSEYDSIQISHNAMNLAMSSNIFPKAKEKNMGIIVKDGLSRGQLTSKSNDVSSEEEKKKIKRLEEIAIQNEMSLAELALRFVLSNKEIATVIIGTKKVENLQANLLATKQGVLSQEFIQKIFEVNV